MPEFKKEDEMNEEKAEELREIGDKMDDELDIGNEIKDQLIPLGLEYYMGVIEDESEGEDEEGMDDDSDDEPKPKGGKDKGGKKGGKKEEGGEQQ